MLDSQAAFIRRLEASGRLNRALEVLPDEEELAQRRQLGHGLLRPEIAVLVSYAKMTLKEELMASGLPDEPYLLDMLVKYFPRVLRKRFAAQIKGHRLRREITATLVANSLVNRGLGAFVSELGEHSGRSADAIARAYIVARGAFALVPLYGQIELLVGQIAADQEIILLDQAREALARGTTWFLRNLPAPIDVRAGVDRFAPGIARVLGQLNGILSQGQRHAFDEVVEHYAAQGIEGDLARALAALPYMFPACEVVAVADQVGVEVLDAGAIYFALDASLQLGHLRDLLQAATPENALGPAGARRPVRRRGRRASPPRHPGAHAQPAGDARRRAGHGAGRCDRGARAAMAGRRGRRLRALAAGAGGDRQPARLPTSPCSPLRCAP